ncbi:porin [uncultured Cohaesibacter sp.]|uniref:porin n=1 Tax=uncultured Cohaesibacter sp. TaxID=1002546 RepID=UPI0029C87D54|nr:porin [uncultured Cohaesibacter sp.]
MNIKSLILGSAAAIVAAGAAQAADLPVAEPVDYVKVCDAYGAGYFFIPGTDTCLSIRGEVTFGMSSHGWKESASDPERADALLDFYTESTVTFQAMEETEYGTLTAHIEVDIDQNGTTEGGEENGDVNGDKVWLSLGGFYAGLTDSVVNYNAGNTYDDFGMDLGDVQAIGYSMAVGNGVSFTVALEEFDQNDDATAATSAAGISSPAFAAEVAVEQGWGSIRVGGSVFQVRYGNAVYDTDLGWALGGIASFNVTDQLSLAVSAGYTVGGDLNPVGPDINSSAAGIMNEEWVVAAGLTYAFSDQVSFDLEADYYNLDDKAGTMGTDLDVWQIAGEVNYTIVPNLTLKARLGYRDIDTKVAGADFDDMRGRVTITRKF